MQYKKPFQSIMALITVLGVALTGIFALSASATAATPSKTNSPSAVAADPPETPWGGQGPADLRATGRVGVAFYDSGHRFEVWRRFRDNTRQLAYSIESGAGNMSAAAVIPGGLATYHAPLLMMFNNRPIVFATADDNSVHYNVYQGGGAWVGWQRVGDDREVVLSRVTVAGTTVNRGQVLMLAFRGTNDHIYLVSGTWAPSNTRLNWFGEGAVPGATTLNTPGIVSMGSTGEGIMVIHRGAAGAGDGHQYYSYGLRDWSNPFESYHWSGAPQEIPGDAISSSYDGGPTAGSANGQVIDVAIRGTTGVVWWTWYDYYAGRWLGTWNRDINQAFTAYAPTLAAIAGYVYMYRVGTGNELYGKQLFSPFT